MEKVDGISSAFVNRSIMLVLSEDKEPDPERLGKVLEPFKMKIKSVEKAPELPY